LQITYLGDAKSVLAAQGQIDAGHSKLEGSTKKTGGLFQSTFGNIMPLAVAAAGAAVVKFAVDTVKAASDQVESLNKAKVVFGDASESVIRFSDNSAKSFGISKAAALEAAGGFGAMLQTAGLAEDASADMSVTMVKLAGDMASFNNQDPSEMLERLRSGLAGEAEPLRKFGVFLSEARVQTEAVNLGLAKQGEALTEAQKVQARYSLILQDTNKQQGDFGRTLGESLPNQIRVAKAEFVDLQAELGTALLPALTDLLKAGTLVVEALGPALKIAFTEAGEQAAVAALAIADVAGVLNDLMSLLPEVGSSAKEGSDGMGLLGHVVSGTYGSLTSLGTALREHGIKDMQGVTGTVQGQSGAVKELNATYGVFQRGVGEAGGEVSSLGKAVARTTEEIRDQRLAVLALTDNFLGIVDSANQVSEAQRELNRLEEKGKEHTKAYEQAVLDALEAQIGLENAVLSYGKELADSGEKQSKVIGKVKDLAQEFGIERDVVQDLINKIKEHIRGLEAVPSHVKTTWELAMTPTREAQHGFHGTIAEDTLFQAHAGERVDIGRPGGGGNGGGGNGGGNIYATINVSGAADPEATARKVRDELLKLGAQSGSIFGGRA
jgi:hypothetical protein